MLSGFPELAREAAKDTKTKLAFFYLGNALTCHLTSKLASIIILVT
jgi:hypothetical protein